MTALCLAVTFSQSVPADFAWVDSRFSGPAGGGNITACPSPAGGSCARGGGGGAPSPPTYLPGCPPDLYPSRGERS